MSRYMYINIMVDMVEREEGGIQTYIPGTEQLGGGTTVPVYIQVYAV